MDANKQNNDPYRSNGGSNGTAGLYRARSALETAPPTITLDDRTYQYDQQVVFFADGIQNVFLNPARADLTGGQSNSATYPNGHVCRSISDVVNDESCQRTEIGGLYNGFERPMTEMVLQGQALQALAEVFVVAIDPFGHLSKRAVASSPEHFFAAETLEQYDDGLNNVDRSIDMIAVQRSVGGVCQAVVDPWSAVMQAENLPEGVDLSLPQVGTLEIRNVSSNATYSTAIELQADSTLAYALESIPPGEYILRAFVYFRGGDGLTRLYGTIDHSGEPVAELTVMLRGGETALPLELRLSGAVCN
ncbi:MAG: hypothetical protein HC822_13105 [Oscillochloris sp.]|nr:hypothetical protein [Oscillochloris sp.]